MYLSNAPVGRMFRFPKSKNRNKWYKKTSIRWYARCQPNGNISGRYYQITRKNDFKSVDVL